MKLDRNLVSNQGRGKYAILNLRKLAETESSEIFKGIPPKLDKAITALEDAGILEWGYAGDPDEFFLIKLKDVNARPALVAYALSIKEDDHEFFKEVESLADRSGDRHPLCKKPD